LGRKLFMHAGPAKTGTSALQAVLRDHDGSVVLYPKAGQWEAGAHHDLVYNYVGDFSWTKTRQIGFDAILNGMAEEARLSDKPIVISSELLPQYDDAGEMIRIIADRLGVSDVEIVLLAREHFALLASHYRWRLMLTYPHCHDRTPDEYVLRYRTSLCLEKFIRRYRDEGFRVSVLNYDPVKDAVPNFLRHVGFSPQEIPEIPIVNRSPGIKAAIARLALNRAGIVGEPRTRSIVAQRALAEESSRGGFIFGPEAARAAEKCFLADREFLHREFGVVIRPPDLDSAQNIFRITEAEYSELAKLARGSDEEKERYREELRHFIRSDSVGTKSERGSASNRKLVVHIGPAGTGCKTIQACLKNFGGPSIVYPLAGQWEDGSHSDLVTSLSGVYEPERDSKEVADAMLACIAEDARLSDKPIVVSSEQFMGRAHVEGIVGLLAASVDTTKVDILFVLREHFELAASVYSRRVLNERLREQNSPDEFLARRRSAICGGLALRALRAAGFKISVLHYRPEPEFVRDVLSYVGVRLPPEAEVPHLNSSLSVKAMIARLVLNRMGLPVESRNKFVRAQQAITPYLDRARFIFGAQAAAAGEDRFQKDRRHLAETFGIEMPAPDLASKVNVFRIGEAEYLELAEAVDGTRDEIERYRAGLRAFVGVAEPLGAAKV
jgi:hypothetical protein